MSISGFFDNFRSLFFGVVLVTLVLLLLQLVPAGFSATGTAVSTTYSIQRGIDNVVIEGIVANLSSGNKHLTVLCQSAPNGPGFVVKLLYTAKRFSAVRSFTEVTAFSAVPDCTSLDLSDLSGQISAFLREHGVSEETIQKFLNSLQWPPPGAV